MTSFAKGKLIFTINSLNNLYGIDERELLLNCLTSLNNNVYNITGFKVPELGQEMYQRDIEELRNTLFKGYIRKIKDTQHDLTDLILNDIFKMYEPRLTDTYNMFISGTFYGGGLPELINRISEVSKNKASRTPPSLIERVEFVKRTSIKARRPRGKPSLPPPRTLSPAEVSTVSKASRTSATSLQQDLIDERIKTLANLGLLEPSLDTYCVAIYDEDKQKLLDKFPKDVKIPENINVAEIKKNLLTNILSIDNNAFQKEVKDDLGYLIQTFRNYVEAISGKCGLNDFNAYIDMLNKRNLKDWIYNYAVISYILKIIVDYLLINPSTLMNQIVSYMLMNLYIFNDEIFNQ